MKNFRGWFVATFSPIAATISVFEVWLGGADYTKELVLFLAWVVLLLSRILSVMLESEK